MMDRWLRRIRQFALITALYRFPFTLIDAMTRPAYPMIARIQSPPANVERFRYWHSALSDLWGNRQQFQQSTIRWFNFQHLLEL